MKFTPVKDRISYGGAMIGKAEVNAINKIIKSQGGRRWTVGPESVAFEKELAEVTGVKRSVLTNSGSSALLIAITALHLPRGSKIIIPACNFPTAFNSIIQAGHLPVIVDIDIKTLNMDLEEVKKAMKWHKDIKAIIAVDIAGNPVDLIELRKIVGSKVKIILDNCDGYGTTLLDRFIDAYADISCISMHAAHIITMGEGGACLTNDEELANSCLKLREWGRASGTDKIYKYPGFPNDYKERYVYEEIGYNMKPLELQCAMGRVQLKKLSNFKRLRQKNHNLLDKLIKDNPKFTLLKTLPNASTCWFSFAMLCNVPRGKIMEELEKNNIECRTIFSGNITKHPAYKNVEMIKIGDFDDADEVMKRGMFLSCHPSITPKMIKFMGETLCKI